MACLAVLSRVFAAVRSLIWSCRAYVPVSQLIQAAFRSKAKGLLPPNDASVFVKDVVR
ncbi:hypothetical protein SAMN06265370_1183 [Puniceibacterium sediminis]|uniref:Uncharacterized protein n=1 Tax=Puniceibacterium sediminis TaxID=1608407 RepID=A0A238YKN3_9RHOB|nr:hypothetical protein SAMN06265370_1183 [Puniceibacterium sediminis]